MAGPSGVEAACAAPATRRSPSVQSLTAVTCGAKAEARDSSDHTSAQSLAHGSHGMPWHVFTELQVPRTTRSARRDHMVEEDLC